MKKIIVSLVGALFILAGCGEKEETPKVDPMVSMSEKIDMEDGIMKCKVNSGTYGKDDPNSAKICLRETSLEICEKYFSAAVCSPD